MKYPYSTMFHNLTIRLKVSIVFVFSAFPLSSNISGSKAITTRLNDPVDIRSNGAFITISNNVDLDTDSGSIKDYNCGKNTYDGHEGTDFELIDFYCMDKGYPVLCAAPGTVYFVQDGASDRNSELRIGDISNTVIIINSDNSVASYLHMRKNSIRVKKGQHVKTGDTLGLIGSSGYSTGPHLHFEISDSNDKISDPFRGACGSTASLWQEQFVYNPERKTEVLTHGLTTLSLSRAMINERPPSMVHFTSGDTIKSWIKVRNIKVNDELTWVFIMPNGEEFIDKYTIAETRSSSWWYSWYRPFQTSRYFGNWKVHVFCNDTLVAIDSCVYDTNKNALPVIESKVFSVKPGGVLTDTLVGRDTEGSIFWYKLEKSPVHGKLYLHGSRQKLFTYTPKEGFSGIDTFIVYCIDNTNVAGNSAIMQIRVNTTNVNEKHIKKDKPWKLVNLRNEVPIKKEIVVFYSVSGKVIGRVQVDERYNQLLLGKNVPSGQLVFYKKVDNLNSTVGQFVKLP